MQKFILLTRMVSEEVHPSFSVQEKSQSVKEKVRELCPDVTWLANYALLGPWDFLDIFQAPNVETAIKLAALVRSYGGAHTEVWPAMEWDEFKGILHQLEGPPAWSSGT
jgi:uncharacterized protein with GYD domain